MVYNAGMSQTQATQEAAAPAAPAAPPAACSTLTAEEIALRVEAVHGVLWAEDVYQGEVADVLGVGHGAVLPLEVFRRSLVVLCDVRPALSEELVDKRVAAGQDGFDGFQFKLWF